MSVEQQLSIFSFTQPLVITIQLCLCEFAYVRYFVKSCSICPSVPGLCHLAYCSPGSSILLHMAGFPSFLRLNDILLYVYITFSLFISRCYRNLVFHFDTH